MRSPRLKIPSIRILATVLVTAISVGAASFGAENQSKALRGWLSDEACARGRANGGIFTGTNPDCAKKCAAQGKKIVLIVPDEKTILEIANQGAAKENIGDYVEVTGAVNPQTKSLHIDSFKLVEKGRAMCSVPPRK